MSTKSTYTFGSCVFQSKKAVETHVGRILRNAVVGEPLQGDDFQCVFDLLCRHPAANKKIGTGVESIRVRLEPRWKSRHFEVVRTNGSATDFCYKNCLSPPTRESLFRKACRHAVADQVISYRNEVFAAVGVGNVRCPILGILLSAENTHVDHVPPLTFENLVRTFIAQYDIDVATVQIAGFNDHEMKKSFVDDELTNCWQLFHKQRAKLRLVSCKANLSHIKRGVFNGQETQGRKRIS